MESNPTQDILNDFANPPLKTAGIGVRFGAAMIDFAIMWGVSFVIGMLWGQKTESADSFGYSLTGFPAFVCFCIWFAIIPVMEGLRSQTIGQRVCKIKVVKYDDSPSGDRNFRRPIQ
ncbi:MAG TPA: RDD family protein [Puia sp.]